MFKDDQRITIGRTSHGDDSGTGAGTGTGTGTEVERGGRSDIVVGPGTADAVAPADAAAPAIPTLAGAPRPFTNWKSLPEDLLIQYINEIRECLPATKLSDLNLEEEMLLQFHTIRNLQSEILVDQSVPANQRAQVANSVAATLNKLVEMQLAIYSSERFKAIELALIRVLSKLPEAAAKEFLDEYEKILGQKNDVFE